MKLTDLNEAGMYNNNRPKIPKAHAVAKSTPSPDDIFVGLSNDRAGTIGVALKGRTAYIPPHVARNLSKELAKLADVAEDKINSKIAEIQARGFDDGIKGVYNNTYIIGSDEHDLYDTGYEEAVMQG